jgi:hypothetical protein
MIIRFKCRVGQKVRDLRGGLYPGIFLVPIKGMDQRYSDTGDFNQTNDNVQVLSALYDNAVTV